MYKNRDHALADYQRLSGKVLNCIAKTWVYSAPAKNNEYILLAAQADRDPKPRITGALLRLKRGRETFLLQANQKFQVFDNDGFRISTSRYFYVIWGPRQNERLIDWHYHSRLNESFEGHLHIRDDARTTKHSLVNRHIPTGRVSLVDIVRFAIEELKIKARDPNWRDVLEEAEATFRQNRTW